ncbi:hypothetical protein [Okeania sp. SIO1I7]|uniref:hypothetical protein n=1 Tax=Okeania sp. SIO1I7 TaxID=2607772 RepID=UPI0013FC0AE2|nr:hypothetical protein [Okeania sp. SIO1I7]NET24429.1 hypothetical protein [Okeania sp. SIO1I7]
MKLLLFPQLLLINLRYLPEKKEEGRSKKEEVRRKAEVKYIEKILIPNLGIGSDNLISCLYLKFNN